jgi:uncharacterized protein YndB with AHSA1/START domain
MSIRIAREPEVVWPYLVDWERLNRWMLEARDFRVTGTRREGVGVEAEARIRIAGITTRDPIRVTRWDPPSILEMEHLGWVKGTGYMELTPEDRGTEMFWRESLVPPWGWLGAVGMRLVTPFMRGAFRRDLSVLRDLVEAET